MQIVIAGAGSVGRSIARELISHGHEVTLVDRSAEAMRIASVPEADWQLADACDIDALERAEDRDHRQTRRYSQLDDPHPTQADPYDWRLRTPGIRFQLSRTDRQPA